MSNIKLTDKQLEVYNVVKSHSDEPVSKKTVAKELDVQIRQISPPLLALVDAGILVTDEYGEYTIGAGVREEDDNSVTIPTPSESPAPPISGQIRDEQDDETDDPHSEYYSLHPEELVTFYQEEGLDILKRHALQRALENTPGVGKKGLEAAIHWFDIDEDLRRDPTILMRSLEDAGVPHKIVGRVAREAFLPEKKYARYLKYESDVIIDRGRPQQGRRNIMINQPPPYNDEYGYTREYIRPPQRQGVQQFTPGTQGQGMSVEPPWWLNQIMSRLDNIENTRGRGKNISEPEDSRIVIEPVLDKQGHPVEDINNPGQYLVRKIVYEGDTQTQYHRSPNRQDAEPEHIKLLREQLIEQKEELKQFKELFREQETERKIYGAISEATVPLIEKINSLERQPAMSGDMTDERFKMITEEKIYDKMTGNVKEMLSDVFEPVVQSVQQMQKMQTMKDIIELEKTDGIPPGTYLKYMAGGGGGADSDISKDRISGTIDKIKKTTK